MDALPPRPAPPRPLSTRVREWIDWFGVGRLLTTALSVIAVAAGGLWLLRPPQPPVEADLPRASSPGSSTLAPDIDTAAPAVSTALSEATDVSTTPPVTIVVHVAGAVVEPGVYRVPAAARVVDAITAAGGATGDGRADALNLASPLRDGDRIYVPTEADAPAAVAGVSSASGGASSSAAVVGPVDVNTATVDELDRLPGVGPATAAAIVAHRDANGPFPSIDAIGDVRGIGPAKLEALRPLVTV